MTDLLILFIHMWKHSFIYNLNKAPGMFIIYIYIYIIQFYIMLQDYTTKTYHQCAHVQYF